ncbi:squalene synthase 8-like [Pistacia vera]|uniref:squalene synthase 8-like n=1 Tax=Pistacia vera TaxID=55513 RepID=UPI0012630689|nr:squalene synthase 8-like [Pistacia vera]
MGTLAAVFGHPDEFYPLLKLKRAVTDVEKLKQIPSKPHWVFCYTILHKVSHKFPLVIQHLDTDLRDAVCIFYLILRALDTVEDDTSIPTEVKVPILLAFQSHVYDRDWNFSCGTKDDKVLMDQFHHVSTAFLELEKGYQKVIEDITQKMGAGMAKFICKKVETIDDYNEYCHYVAGLVGLGLSELFHASGKEDMAPEHLSSSMGVFLQKANIIRDYLEDIRETPKPRMFWPQEIWNKYVNKLEDLQYEENSVKAVECFNDMVTNALTHVEDCFKYMSGLRDPVIFRFCAIPQVMDIGTLALCCNNIEVFKGAVKMRRGLSAKIIDRTNVMSDLYGAFYDFSCMLKSKINKNDPNATKTLNQINAIQKVCMERHGRHYVVSGIKGKDRTAPFVLTIYFDQPTPDLTPSVIFPVFLFLSMFIPKIFLAYLDLSYQNVYSFSPLNLSISETPYKLATYHPHTVTDIYAFSV